MTIVYSRKRLRAQRRSQSTSPPASPSKPTQLVSTPPRQRPRSSKRRKLVQLHLDAGQSDISAKKCATCGLVYAPGAPADEAVHKTRHAAALRAARPPFRHLPGARVLRDDGHGQYICVRAGDAAQPVRQARAMDGFVTERLGGRGDAFRSFGQAWRDGEAVNWLVVVLVREAFVCGYLYAERVEEARVATVGRDGVACVGDNIVTRVLCGVRKIWVAEEVRRGGVASAMIDLARENLVYGYEVSRGDVAFTATTTDGGLLASSYAARYGLGRILVYTK